MLIINSLEVGIGIPIKKVLFSRGEKYNKIPENERKYLILYERNLSEEIYKIV